MLGVAEKSENLTSSQIPHKKLPKCLIFKEFLAFEEMRKAPPGRAGKGAR